MSVPTDPVLLQKLTSGKITHDEYRIEMELRNAREKAARTATALDAAVKQAEARGYTACNNPEQVRQLVASEKALVAEGLRKTQEYYARQLAEQQQRQREAEYIQNRYRQLDQARAAVGSGCATGSQEEVGRQDMAARLAIEQEKRAISDAQAQRMDAELYRQRVLSEPMDWQNLPAEQQGYAIAEEVAGRRAALAEELGDELPDERPAYQIAPIVGLPCDRGLTPEDFYNEETGIGFFAPDYAVGYKPAQPASPIGSLPGDLPGFPETDDYPTDSPVGDACGSGGCGGGGGSYSGGASYGALPGYTGESGYAQERIQEFIQEDPSGGGAMSGKGLGGIVDEALRVFDEGGSYRVDIGPGFGDVGIAPVTTPKVPEWLIWVLVAFLGFIVIKVLIK